MYYKVSKGCSHENVDANIVEASLVEVGPY